MDQALINGVDALFRQWACFEFTRIINVHALKEGDIIILRTAEPLDQEILVAVRKHLLSQRPDLNSIGIMNVGLDEDIEVVHQRALNESK